MDGLAKRDMTATEMTEHFESRPDFLYYRHVTFSKITKKFEPAEKVQRRPIVVSHISFILLHSTAQHPITLYSRNM